MQLHPSGARSAWQAMNIIHLIDYCSAIYKYLNEQVYCARVYVTVLVRSRCRTGKMATRHRACIIYPIPKARTPIRHSLLYLIYLALCRSSNQGHIYIYYNIYYSPMSMIAGHTFKWMCNNNSILYLKMGAMSLVG